MESHEKTAAAIVEKMRKKVEIRVGKTLDGEEN